METEKPRGIAALFGGSPQQVLCAFDIAWPAVLESVFVALAGLIDSLMVSTLGAAAVASVGLTTQPKFIALSLFIALNVSVSALVARRKGQKDRDGANQVLMMALGFTLVMGLVLGAVCIAFAPTFMDLAGSNAETHDNAVLYFRIVVGGMIFSVLSLIINAAQRGSGNTRLSMRANVASSLVNITFNWLLINGHLGFPALGMKGAALATVLGTVVACCMSIFSILREDSFVSIPYMLRKKVRPGAENALVVVKLCASCFVEQIFLRIGFMATAVMAADLGTAPMAAHQVGMNFLSLSFAFGDGMQVAAITLVGQSLGQKDPALARSYGRVCQRMGFCISVVLSIILRTLSTLSRWFSMRTSRSTSCSVTSWADWFTESTRPVPERLATSPLTSAGGTLSTITAYPSRFGSPSAGSVPYEMFSTRILSISSVSVLFTR